jgi:hypothetical protein
MSHLTIYGYTPRRVHRALPPGTQKERTERCRDGAPRALRALYATLSALLLTWPVRT